MLPLSQLRTIASACLALALLVLLPLPALAQKTIYIDGGCSFSEAIASANATSFVIPPTLTPTVTPTPSPTPTYTPTATPEGTPPPTPITTALPTAIPWLGCELGDPSKDEFDTIILTDSRYGETGAGSELITSKIIFNGRHEKENHTLTGRAAGGSYHQMFQVGAGGDLTVKNVKIRNATPNRGESNEAATDASVYIEATGGRVTIENVTFENNISTNNTIKDAVVGVKETGGTGVVHVWHSRFRDSQSTSETGSGNYAVRPVVTGRGVTVYRSVFINNEGKGHGFVITDATVSASTITESKATNTGATAFAVSGAKLRNVTLAHNNSGGITAPEGLKNSIVYYNSGVDCGGHTVAVNDSNLFGPNSINEREEGNQVCTDTLKTYHRVLGRTPDIDDDIDDSSWYLLEPGADAIGYGWDCEVADQRGHPYGPNPCDLGAISSWDPDADKPAPAGPSPTPNLTRTPFHTPVPTATASPTPYPTVDGWMLFSDYEGVLAKTVTAAGVGIAHIVELGFISAIDIWGEVGWGVTACHTRYSNGTFVFLDAAGMPREAVTWPAAPPINGMACTYIETEGTVVMLRAERWSEPPTPTPRENLPSFGPPTPFQLEGCTLITRDMVNLRAEEWGDVLTIIPFETELPATEVTEEFYKVTFEEQEGFVHRDWVTIVAGVCA